MLQRRRYHRLLRASPADRNQLLGYSSNRYRVRGWRSTAASSNGRITKHTVRWAPTTGFAIRSPAPKLRENLINRRQLRPSPPYNPAGTLWTVLTRAFAKSPRAFGVCRRAGEVPFSEKAIGPRRRQGRQNPTLALLQSV